MAEGYWVIRTYQAGPMVGEKTKYWVPGARPSRSERKVKAEIKKQEQNEYSAQKRLARVINANFTPGDRLLGLDYSEKGMERLLAWIGEQEKYRGLDMDSEAERMNAIYEAAEHELELALRRVKRAMAKDGLELRCVAITSDMDGDTGEAVRIHHHLVVNRESKQAFIDKWQELGLGGVDWEDLKEQDDYTPIAEYFIRQVRRIPDARKYKSSRNLIRPVPKDRVAITDAEVRPPKGAKLLHRSEFKPGRPQYIRYVLPGAKRPPREFSDTITHAGGHTPGRANQDISA